MKQIGTPQNKANVIPFKIDHTDPETGEHFIALLSGPQGLFSRAAQNPDIAPLNGADLFNALVKEGAYPNYAEYRNKDGDYHDAADGTAADREWGAYGRLSRQRHIRNGLPHDGVDGTAAILNWHTNGTLREECYYQDGRTHDGANGAPAMRYWNENDILTRYVNKSAGIDTTDPLILAQIQKQEESQGQIGYKASIGSPA